MVELHTGKFANTLGEERATETARLVQAAEQAHALGLEVHAGHGIQLSNLAELNAVPHLTELNIGHTIISRAIFCGLTTAVNEMKTAIAGFKW
jgi:pyridoxine 5-phosphate synthase